MVLVASIDTIRRFELLSVRRVLGGGRGRLKLSFEAVVRMDLSFLGVMEHHVLDGAQERK